MFALLIVVQMIISVLLVLSILLQSSKGGGLAGIAGGMMSSTVFGGRGAASFLAKATTVLATVFFLNCLGMAVISTHAQQRASVTQQTSAQQEKAPSPVPEMPGTATLPTEQAPPSSNGKPTGK